MGKQQSTLRHRAAIKSRAATPAPIPTMVWSGGDDWMNSKASIVALASALPAAMARFDPWTQTVPSAIVPTMVSIPGKLTLSIGGSAASDSGWSAMASGGVDNWVGYFKNLFVTSGLDGIDWDLENITTTSTYDFIGQVSQQLKAAGHTITFTIMQSKNIMFPPMSFLQTYAGACTYIVLMLYDSGMYVDGPTSPNNSWCDYAANTLAALPPALQSKFMYALYPYNGTPSHSCCALCIQQAVDYIRAGKGVGIAFWCFGGYTGACSGELSKQVVAAWVDVLNNGGGSGVDDFMAAFPTCSSETSKDGCGRDVNPTATFYACSGSACNSSPSCTATTPGCYTTNTCNNECSQQQQMFACTGTACTEDPNGTYTSRQACSLKCGTSTQMYSCNCGACKPDPNGQYSTMDCDGQCSAPTAACASMGVSVPTGGACGEASAQFTCNGQTRCCCLGTVPFPSATNPTACTTSAAAASRARFYAKRYPF